MPIINPDNLPPGPWIWKNISPPGNPDFTEGDGLVADDGNGDVLLAAAGGYGTLDVLNDDVRWAIAEAHELPALRAELAEQSLQLEDARALVRRVLEQGVSNPADLPDWVDEEVRIRGAQPEPGFPGPDQDDAIVRLRELLEEARFIAWDYHHGKSDIYSSTSLPWPDWITTEQSPLQVFVHIDGVNNAPSGSRLARALRQRDEARLWAHGDYHRSWPFHTDVVPLWLHSSTLPADPEVVREWQRRHPERRIEEH